MKITTPTATLGIRGTSGLVEVPEGASATSKNNVNVKLYPDADGRVGRIEVNDRAGARLGFLTHGVERLCDPPRRRRRALCRRADHDHAADDRARHRVLCGRCIRRKLFGRRVFDEQRAFRRANPGFVNPNRPMRQPGQFRQNNLPGQPGGRPERLAGTNRPGLQQPGLQNRPGQQPGLQQPGAPGPAGPAAAAGFAAAGRTIAAAGPARSGNQPGQTGPRPLPGQPGQPALPPLPNRQGQPHATGRIAVATDRGSATTGQPGLPPRPGQPQQTGAPSARTTRLAATAGSTAETGVPPQPGRPGCRLVRPARQPRLSQPPGQLPGRLPAQPYPGQPLPGQRPPGQQLRDSRHCRRQAPDNSAKAASPARPACNGRDSGPARRAGAAAARAVSFAPAKGQEAKGRALTH